MQTLGQDLRYALRLARRRPALTLVTILTLAIGVGGNTATFSLVNALLLRPLPVPEPERLVRVFGTTDDHPFDVLSYPNAMDFAARAKTLASLAIHQQTFVASGLGDAPDTAAVSWSAAITSPPSGSPRHWAARCNRRTTFSNRRRWLR